MKQGSDSTVYTIEEKYLSYSLFVTHVFTSICLATLVKMVRDFPAPFFSSSSELDEEDDEEEELLLMTDFFFLVMEIGSRFAPKF